MDALKQMLEVNYGALFISVMVILVGIKTVWMLGEWFVDKFGICTTASSQRKQERELLIKTAESLTALQEALNALQEKHEKDMMESGKKDEEIMNGLNNLSDLMTKKTIKDMRRDILVFCDDLYNNKRLSKENYNDIFNTYDEYEKILKDNNMTNGQVEESMRFIRDTYHENLSNGTFN